MPQVCFKPMMSYLEMHHVRIFFLCGVMTFLCYVMFIHRMFIFKWKAYWAFCVLRKALRTCPDLSGSYFIFSWYTAAMLPVLWQIKSAVSFPFEHKHVMNDHLVIQKSHDATQKKSLHVVHWNKLAASKTLLWRRQKKLVGVALYWEE